MGGNCSYSSYTPTITNVGHVLDLRIKQKLRSAQRRKLKDQVPGQAWQGKLIASRWEEEQGGAGTGDVRRCHSFSWLWQWRTCPTFVIASVYELYEQLPFTTLPSSVQHTGIGYVRDSSSPRSLLNFVRCVA